ncbi:MAG: hypothetical protein ACE5HS_06495 [bacterium]
MKNPAGFLSPTKISLLNPDIDQDERRGKQEMKFDGRRDIENVTVTKIMPLLSLSTPFFCQATQVAIVKP